MIAPSDEDSFTFTVSAANGDIFKLRGKYVVHLHVTGPSRPFFVLSVTHPILAPLLSKDVNLSRLVQSLHQVIGPYSWSEACCFCSIKHGANL